MKAVLENMDEQGAFSQLLYGNGHGVALRHPTQEIDVGDLCYWDADGRATRILNVFDNKEVHFSRGGTSINRSGLRKTSGPNSKQLGKTL